MQNVRTMGGAVAHPAWLQSREPGVRLSRRPATAADHDFLFTLFEESRPELALLPEAVRPALTRMQFDSQRGQYRGNAPDALDWIVELDHGGRAEPAGRCYVQQGGQEHRLLDLAISSRWRRQGLASTVLAWLCADAAQAGVPLRLTVWHANHDALRLYQRHGFVADDAESGHDAQPAGYLRLRWSAGGRR